MEKEEKDFLRNQTDVQTYLALCLGSIALAGAFLIAGAQLLSVWFIAALFFGVTLGFSGAAIYCINKADYFRKKMDGSSEMSQPIVSVLPSSQQANNVRMTGKEIDKIFELCLLLVTVLAAALLAYASYVYPLNGAISNLAQVNLIFRVTTVLIVSMVCIWIASSIIPSTNAPIGILRKFRRRFVKEFCWGLFGNLFAYEILAFVFFAFSSKLVTAFLTVDYATFAAVFLTFPATWGYTKLDRQETSKKLGNLNWLRSKLAHPLTEHTIIFLIAFLIVQRVILFCVSFSIPSIS